MFCFETRQARNAAPEVILLRVCINCNLSSCKCIGICLILRQPTIVAAPLLAHTSRMPGENERRNCAHLCMGRDAAPHVAWSRCGMLPVVITNPKPRRCKTLKRFAPKVWVRGKTRCRLQKFEDSRISEYFLASVLFQRYTNKAGARFRGKGKEFRCASRIHRSFASLRMTRQLMKHRCAQIHP